MLKVILLARGGGRIVSMTAALWPTTIYLKAQFTWLHVLCEDHDITSFTSCASQKVLRRICLNSKQFVKCQSGSEKSIVHASL